MFFAMIHQVSSGVSLFSGCLEFSPEFLQISISPTNVIPLAMSEVRLPRKLMSFFPLSLGVEPNESIALHLPVAHDEISRQIAICNDHYIFHSILQEFAVVNEVTCMFYPEIMGTFHTRRTSTCRILRRIAFITDKLDIIGSWYQFDFQ